MTKEELYYLPASELLKHIQTEKDRLIKEKIIKKSKPLPPITDEEKPYDLPANWEWVRLGDIVNFFSGSAFPVKYQGRNNEAINFFKVGSLKDVDKNNLLHQSENTINETDLKELNIKLTPPNTIVFAKIGEAIRLNRRAILANYSCIDNNLMGIRTINEELLRNKFLFQWLKQVDLYELSNATAVPSVKKSVIELLLFPLPPLYIQDQIVQKLEQLSEIKDSLLYHADQQFNYTKKMREALLQEAIRGELVPQHDNDEPASVLLEKINTEKERLIKEKVIKKPKELPPITDEDKPYELPNGWEWVRLDQICKVVTCGYASTPKYVEDGMPFISAKNVKPYKFMADKYQMISRELYDKLVSGAKPEKNDILVTRVGAGIGEAAIIDKDFDFAIYVSLTLIKPLQQFISSKYLLHWFNSPHGSSKSRRNTFGAGSSQGNLNVNEVRNFLIPLPPLAEQERIVAKLDELMANCDQLEAKAEDMKNYTTRLFEASLKEAFMPE